LCLVGSKACDQGHLDTLFIAVNTGVSRKGPKRMGKKGQNAVIKAAAEARDMTLSAADAEADNKFNSVKTLNRQEFFQCIVKIAAMRYVISGSVRDMSVALEKLAAHVTPKLPRYARHNADDFRAKNCYIEETDAVLRKYEHTISVLYAIYSASDHDLGSKANAGTVNKSLMGYDEYLGMITDLELIEPSFSMREAKLSFIWSRMRAIDELHPKCRVKIYNLTLEDFYEALVRIADLKAWPTDDEICNPPPRVVPQAPGGGFEDAGQLLLHLHEKGGKKGVQKFLQSRDGAAADAQPIWRKLEHLLTLILRTVEGRSQAGASDMKLTKKEVQNFARSSKAFTRTSKGAR